VAARIGSVRAGLEGTREPFKGGGKGGVRGTRLGDPTVVARWECGDSPLRRSKQTVMTRVLAKYCKRTGVRKIRIEHITIMQRWKMQVIQRKYTLQWV
jgi:hypothetical protein